MKSPKLNSELFPLMDAPKQQKPNTYYAYLDAVEQVRTENEQTKMFLRFDCFEKNVIDDSNITLENINRFPSIIIDLEQNKSQLMSLFKYGNLYLLESQWMIIKTVQRRGEQRQRQYFNFELMQGLNFGIEEVTLQRNFDNTSKVKVAQLLAMQQIQVSPESEVREEMGKIDLGGYHHINVYNVGQGNCTALVANDNHPLLYFDVGGGFGANNFPGLANFRLCSTDHPPVILSHWHQDHIHAASYAHNSGILASTWFVPAFQRPGPTALRILNGVSRMGRVVGLGLNPQTRRLGRLLIKAGSAANPHNKNNSGLSLVVPHGRGKKILLPADCSFHLTRLVSFVCSL